MSAAIENIPVNWIRPIELKDQLETKVEFFLDAKGKYSGNWLYDKQVIGFASTFFLRQQTYWYTALEKLNLLPDLVPTLPENFYEIYFGNCPIKEMEGNLKKDGTPYKLYETHSLYLIPPESLDNLEARVGAYGRDVLGAQNDDENPLRLDAAYPPTDGFEHIESDRWEWVLIPNEVLEVSLNKTFSQQLETLETLNQRVTVGPNYGVGTLKQVAAFLFFHKVATGESFYEAGNAQNGDRASYVRVQDNEGDDDVGYDDADYLGIGGSSRSGVRVFYDGNDACYDCLGLAALRKFSQNEGSTDFVE